MRTIYLDSENKCHVADDGNMVAVEVDHFDGKCDAFVEGHCCVVDENSIAIWSWIDYAELDAVQREYEKHLLADYEAELTELRENSILAADLEAAYQEGVNTAYDQ